MSIGDYQDGSLLVWADNISFGQILAKGVGYMTSLLIGFDKEPELEDMLDTREMSKLALELTENTSGDTVSVVVEEEILY